MTATSKIEVATKADLLKAIRTANEIQAVIHFGVNESWSKISKATAKELADGIASDFTPADMEMYSGSFGSLETQSDGYKILFLG